MPVACPQATVSPGTPNAKTVTVGSGGAGGRPGATSDGYSGSTGGPSSISGDPTWYADGGGGGGRHAPEPQAAGEAGGAGGGGGDRGTGGEGGLASPTDQGNPGGDGGDKDGNAQDGQNRDSDGGEAGQNGYMWYLKAEGDTRARFTDYIEMALLEGEFAVAGSVVENTSMGMSASTTGYDAGTEGLFKAITTRGHQSTGITGVNPATDLAEFDAALAVFDQNGAIEENMMFVDRTTSLAIDDMLASMNSYGAGGTSYGVFQNSEEMALNLGFSGFRRGSYDFYKSDMKYLNDKALRGGLNDTVNAIRGVMIPAGVSSVYDENLGKNLKRPFLHVRYKVSDTDDRKMKTWITGSVGAATSGKDVMEVHYLSERCLITQGANNFMLLN